MKLPRRSILITLFTLFTIQYSAVTSPVHAEVSIVVSPPQYNLQVQSGDTIQKTIKITNNSDFQSVTLQALVEDFIVVDNLGTPISVTNSASGRYLASPWFTLSQEKFTLKPKQTIELTALISIPKNALPGGHYAGVFFHSIVNKTIQGTNSILASRIGSLFSLTIAGDIKYDALIKNFQTEKFISPFGPIEFFTTIENQSDTHIRPKASISIHNILGQKLTSFPLEEVNIFPFASRTLTGQWDTTWRLGRYTATLDISYGPGLTASRTIYFWILPYHIILAILVILLTLIASYISIRRHLLHRADTSNQEIEALKRRIAELENR